MYQNKKILALIPARGGSKGLPGKNIRMLADKPLIAWSIECARRCTYLDYVLVSTDDKKIADVARKFKAEVPFLRPAEYAQDNSPTIDVITHAMDFVSNTLGQQFELVLLLQPTSPLRSTEDIQEALKLLSDKRARAIVSVCEMEHPPLWSNVLPPDKCMKDFLRPEVKNTRRQDYPTYYRLNGAIFLGDWDYIKANRGFLGEDTYAYVMPRDRSFDIDNELDLSIVEAIIKKRGRKI